MYYIGVAAQEYNPPDPITSAVSGPHSLRIPGRSGPHSVRTDPQQLRTAREHRSGLTLIENGSWGLGRQTALRIWLLAMFQSEPLAGPPLLILGIS
jgi:hypothetical protein